MPKPLRRRQSRSPLVLVPPSISPTPKPPTQCTYPGCLRTAVTKGECFRHYQQRRRAAIKAKSWRAGEEPSEYARTVALEVRRRVALMVIRAAGLV